MIAKTPYLRPIIADKFAAVADRRGDAPEPATFALILGSAGRGSPRCREIGAAGIWW
jgi:hypothetical protein